MAVSDQEARELIAMFDSCDPFKLVEAGDASNVIGVTDGDLCIDTALDPKICLPVWNRLLELMAREHNYRDQGLHPDIDVRLPFFAFCIGEGLYYFGAYEEAVAINEQIATMISWEKTPIIIYNAVETVAKSLYAQGMPGKGKRYLKMWLEQNPDWGYGWLTLLRLQENDMIRNDYRTYVSKTLHSLKKRKHLDHKELILPAVESLLKGNHNPYRLEFLGKNVTTDVVFQQEFADKFKGLLFMSLRVTGSDTFLSIPNDSPAGRAIHPQSIPFKMIQ